MSKTYYTKNYEIKDIGFIGPKKLFADELYRQAKEDIASIQKDHKLFKIMKILMLFLCVISVVCFLIVFGIYRTTDDSYIQEEIFDNVLISIGLTVFIVVLTVFIFIISNRSEIIDNFRLQYLIPVRDAAAKGEIVKDNMFELAKLNNLYLALYLSSYNDFHEITGYAEFKDKCNFVMRIPMEDNSGEFTFKGQKDARVDSEYVYLMVDSDSDFYLMKDVDKVCTLL